MSRLFRKRREKDTARDVLFSRTKESINHLELEKEKLCRKIARSFSRQFIYIELANHFKPLILVFGFA